MRSEGRFGLGGIVAMVLVACGDPGAISLGPGFSATSHGAAGVDSGSQVGEDASTANGGGGSGGGGGDGTGAVDAGSGANEQDASSSEDAGAPPSPASADAGIPCNVAAVLASKCIVCHADPPLNGSLSGLVTVSDLLATSKEDATKNEAQLSLARMQSATSPMPPASVGNAATAADIQAFQAWISGNYQGSCSGDAGAPPATNVFSGAPAFVSTASGSSHNAGKNCMNGCHNHGFTFAGTLTDGKGNAVAGAEVRLVDAKGIAISVHTGPTGNFHSSTAFTAPAHVGARDGTNEVTMVTPLQSTNGGCNGCHAAGGTTPPIHLP